MTPRKKIPKEVVASVVLLSRRRCAICFGLRRDAGIKQGQIAHLNGDPSGNDPDNLVFLCLECHDLFDSRRSQSKGLTPLEVREFRRELHEAIGDAWRQPIAIGEVTFQPSRWPEGHYLRESAFEQAELDVKLVSPRRVHVTGFAFWGTTRPLGPNMGELDFEAELNDNTVVYEDRLPRQFGAIYRAALRFRDTGLTVDENYVIGYFGMNVSFAGEYTRR